MLSNVARRNAWALAVGALAALVLVWHARGHLPFISDDTFISLRYARRLLDGQGLTWTEGPRVEGYTNLLWLLACAGLGALGVDLVVASRALGFAGMIAALFAVVYTTRPRSFGDAGASLFAALGLALSGAFAVWTVGGLEQPFVAAFLAGSIALLHPIVRGEAKGTRARVLGAGVLLGLLCLSRADGPVLCVAVGLGLVAALGFRASAWRMLPRLAAFPLLMAGGQLVFRRLYYGDWVPNTARVKVALSSKRIQDGIEYVQGGALSYVALVAAAVVALIVCVPSRARRPRVVFPAVVAAVWLAYVAFVGGDLFPARRHWVAALVPVALLAAELWRLAVARPGWGRVAAPVVGIALLGAHAESQSDAREPENRRAREERWEWDGKIVGELLHDAFGAEQPLLAVDPAGAVPYYSRLPAIDMLGLNDHHIARQRPRGFGKGWMGHELGDGRYVLGKKPDLVLFALPHGSEKALFRSGKQMEADRRFREQYRLLRFEAPRPGAPARAAWLRSLLWTRVESERIGVRREDRRVTIPGYLFAAPKGAAARLDEEKRLVCLIRGTGKGALERVKLAPGTWRVSADSTAPVDVEVWESGAQAGAPVHSGPPPGSFEIAAGKPSLVDIVVRARGQAELRALALERIR